MLLQQRAKSPRKVEPLVLRVERELTDTGDLSDLTWALVIRDIDALLESDLRRILALLSTY
jgi:hypothetical protein